MGKFDSHASLVTLPSSCQISLQSTGKRVPRKRHPIQACTKQFTQYIHNLASGDPVRDLSVRTLVPVLSQHCSVSAAQEACSRQRSQK